MKNLRKGEIATVLTIGALIVLGITSFISSNFLKNKQTIRSSAAVSCTSCNGQGQCIYHPELDPRSGIAPPGTTQCEDNGCVNDQECQNLSCQVNGLPCDSATKCCNGLTCNTKTNQCEPLVVDTGKCPVDNKRYFDNEITARSVCGAAGYNGVPTAGGYISQCWQCNPNPCPGKWDMNYSCNPACCSDDSPGQCPSGQKCGVPNGFCISGKSCAATSPTSGVPKYIRMCSGATCAWTFCDGKNVPWELCVNDTNTVRTEPPWCSSNDFCKTWVPTPAPGVNSCIASNGKSLSCGPTVTEPECCMQGKAKKVHRDCSQSNTSGCVYWCEDGKGGKTTCDDPAACAFDNKQCNAKNLPTAPPRQSQSTCNKYGGVGNKNSCEAAGCKFYSSCNACVSLTTTEAAACPQNICSQYNGRTNKEKCIANGCDFFMVDETAKNCDKCVVKGTKLDIACPQGKEGPTEDPKTLCPKFDGAANSDKCIKTNVCNFFQASTDNQACNKCVPKDVSVDTACPRRPAAAAPTPIVGVKTHKLVALTIFNRAWWSQLDGNDVAVCYVGGRAPVYTNCAVLKDFKKTDTPGRIDYEFDYYKDKYTGANEWFCIFDKKLSYYNCFKKLN